MHTAIMAYLLTAVLVLSGPVVKALPSNATCQEEITPGLPFGTGVTVQASCYPNGTVSYNWWKSSSLTWNLQIEYQCYNNGTTHEQTPNPVIQQNWSDITNDNGILNIQPWEEGTLCIFSGCYENSQERNHPTHPISKVTCTVHTSHAVMTSSPTLPMASTLLLPTTTHLTPSPSPSHTPALHTPSPPVHIISHLTPSPSQSHTPALHTPSPPVHIISHLTPSLTTRSLPHTSPTIQPETPNTGLLVGITVTVVAVLTSLLGLVAVLGIIGMYKNGQPKYPPIITDKKLDSEYSPVSLEEGKHKIMESIETIFVPWIDIDLVSYDKPPRTYIKPTSSPDYIAAPLDQGKVHVAPYKHDSGIVHPVDTENSDLILAPRTELEEGVEVKKVAEEVKEKEEEKERLEIAMEDERDDPHHTRSRDGYVSLESIKHRFSVPEDEPPEELTFKEPETSPELCIGGVLQSHLNSGNSSRSSGYVSDRSLMWNGTSSSRTAANNSEV